ncbi:hypothetical protein J6590_002165 [Homalodisca vitripennis]|nr:hypothetical protein J6590_002165 [Homalodisca vitripennis]
MLSPTSKPDVGVDTDHGHILGPLSDSSVSFDKGLARDCNSTAVLELVFRDFN